MQIVSVQKVHKQIIKKPYTMLIRLLMQSVGEPYPSFQVYLTLFKNIHFQAVRGIFYFINFLCISLYFTIFVKQIVKHYLSNIL